MLDLAELDGHVAGLALTALGASRPTAFESREVAEHAARLRGIAVTRDDTAVYEDCVAYIEALQRVENALAGRA